MSEPTFADALAGMKDGKMSEHSLLFALLVHLDLLNVPIPTPDQADEAVRRVEAARRGGA